MLARISTTFYIVAYQTMHRKAHVKAGDKALISGASGGIGTALLQLGRPAGLNMYAIASQAKHAVLNDAPGDDAQGACAAAAWWAHGQFWRAGQPS